MGTRPASPALDTRAGLGIGIRPWALLAAAGGVSLACYLLLLIVVRSLQVAEPSYAGQVLPGVPFFTREAMVKNHGAASIRFVGLLLVLFASYAVALRTLAGRRSGRLEAAVFGLGALFLAIQLVQPAMLSTDVYAYTLYGRMFALYGDDPYAPAYFKYPDDPYTPLTYGLPWPSWYGPLWTLLSAAVALLGGERIGLTVLLFRALAVVSALVVGGLLWACLRRLAPERAAQGLAFFLWNPLVVLESGMSGHNDAFMAALLMLGIWLHLGGRRVLAVTAFSLSVLVKLVTGLILPLYGLLVLREIWARRDRPLRETGRFLLLGGAAAGLTAALVFSLARTSPLIPIVQSARAAYFYDNNVYQLVFPILRVWLGEEPESAWVPVHFYPWWALTEKTVGILAAPQPEARTLERVRNESLVLVIAPREERWVRVYNPASGRRGYLHEDGLVKTERPHERANADPLLGQLERNPATGPIAQRANDLLRGVVLLAFGAVYLLAAWRATDLRRFLTWSTVAMLGVYWLVATEIWPWYVIWSLALAALVPTARPALLAALLSATVLTLYVGLGYERTAQAWLFTYRSLPAFVLPLALFAIAGLWSLASSLESKVTRRAGNFQLETVDRKLESGDARQQAV